MLELQPAVSPCTMTVRTRPVAVLLAACSALLLAGCGDAGDPRPESSPATSTPAVSSGPASTPAAASPSGRTAAATPAAPASPAGSPQLLLEPGGLGLPTGSSVRRLAFGTDGATLSETLRTALGPVTRQTLDECGQGARIQLSSAGFSVLLDGATFVGWTDSGRSARRLTTASGIGVGSTLAGLRSAYAQVTVTEGTLGPEFSTGADLGLGGLLDGTAPTSKITTIYAGETCFFR